MMSHWNRQNLDMLQKQAIQRICAAELELIAARAVLSEIETTIVINYLWDNCHVGIRNGICTLNAYPGKPTDVIVETIHPLSYCRPEHVAIEFRAFTTKGKPCKTTGFIAFEGLLYFTKKTNK